MPERPSPFPKRVTAWLFGGTVFGLGVALGIWAGTRLEIPLQTAARTGAERSGKHALQGRDSSARTNAHSREVKEGLYPDLENEEVQHLAAAPPRAAPSRRSSRTETKESYDDSALLATQERLEQCVAAGVARARESVLALDYAATDGPADSRRVATGVVINTDGDVLSVRIDRPAGSQPAGPGGPTATATATVPAPIVARDSAGRRHIAQWIAADQESGLTLLRIPPRVVRPIKVATERPALASQVVVVGNPFGLGHTVSWGHIAGLDRALKLRSRQLGGLIQVQAPLYPGDSGAVVANLRGQLLGLIRSGLAIPVVANDRARTERDNDFGFAITAHDALWVADQLRAHGHVDRAYLGVRLEPPDQPASQSSLVVPKTALPERADAARPRRQSEPDLAAGLEGAYLYEVITGTPAALAGLEAGDSIVELDGQPIRSSHDLTQQLDRILAGAEVRLNVLRSRGPKRQRLTLDVRTGSRDVAAQLARVSPSAPEGSTNPPPTAESGTVPGAVAAGSASAPAPAATPTSTPTPASPAPEPALTVTPTAAPVDSAIAVAASPSAGPIHEQKSQAAPTAPDAKPKTSELQAQTQTQHPGDVRGSAPVSIPAPARSPLRAAVPPPQAEELRLTLPRAVTDRLEELERRLNTLERRPNPTPDSRQPGGAARHP
jgi:S1-C subfamily serine protease